MPRSSGAGCARRLVAVAALAGALAGVGGTSAGAAISTSSGIHLWRFDGRPANPPDAAYANEVARQADILVGRDGWKPYIAGMHTAHPGIIVSPYRSGVAVGGTDLDWVKKNHPDWLLKDTNGRTISNEWGLTLINPANAGVRQWEADRAKKDQAAGWDATYLDALGLYGLLSSSSKPVDPSTKKPFTMDTWIRATAGLAAYVDKAITIPLIANGARDGRTYYGYTDSGTFVGTKALTPSAQGHVFEGCFRPAKAALSAWPTLQNWTYQINAIADVQRQGKMSLCMIKTWGSGATAASRQQWHDFALASTLLVNAGKSYFLFSGEPGEASNTMWPNERAAIGAPTGAYTRQGAAYVRKFSTGVVVVNPGATAQTVSLGGTYKTSTGASVTTVKANPHTGQILVKG
jgi:hypothetical protein